MIVALIRTLTAEKQNKRHFMTLLIITGLFMQSPGVLKRGLTWLFCVQSTLSRICIKYMFQYNHKSFAKL